MQAFMSHILEHAAGAGGAHSILALLSQLPGSFHLLLSLLCVLGGVYAALLGEASRRIHSVSLFGKARVSASSVP